MRYRHTPQFDALLREAFAEAAAREASRERVCKRAGVGRMMIQRWEADQAQKLLPEQVARKLWGYLSPTSIEMAISQKEDTASYKKDLFVESEIADSMMGFFAVHEKNNRVIHGDGLRGRFIGYKNSYLHVDQENKRQKVIRSLIEIQLVDNSYFHVTDKQIFFGPDKAESPENSEGFGFIKTDKFWMFLREIEKDQPRIFCFPRIEDFGDMGITLKGYLIETGRKFVDVFSHSPVVLMPELREKTRFQELNHDSFNIEKHIGVVSRNEVGIMWPDIVDILNGDVVPW